MMTCTHNALQTHDGGGDSGSGGDDNVIALRTNGSAGSAGDDDGDGDGDGKETRR